MQRLSQVPRFHFLILLATLVPLIATPLGIAGGVNDLLSQYDATVVSLVLGSGHVAATSFFFIDKDARQIVTQNPNRFIVIPLVLITVFTTYVYITGIDGARYLIFINVLYLFFHYQKQNFGLISLANRGLPHEARPLVNGILFLPMVAGYILYGQYLLKGSSLLERIAPYTGSLNILATCLFAGGVLSMLVLFYRFGGRINLPAKILTVSTCLFFAPLFLFPDSPALAFGSFAAAHGAQYLLIMSYTVAGTRSSIMFLRAIATIVVVCLILEAASRNLLLMGIAMGLTWGHYMIDARIWKLSLPDSRAYILSRIKEYI